VVSSALHAWSRTNRSSASVPTQVAASEFETLPIRAIVQEIFTALLLAQQPDYFNASKIAANQPTDLTKS
jgi:hypothetical protein